MNHYFRTARPRQWLKNLLVFSAPGAAGVLTDIEVLLQTLVAFSAMCLAASGTYFWNDVLDVRSDRAHPSKSRRPIAAGDVSIRAGRVIGSTLPLVAVLLVALIGEWRPVVVVVSYVVITLTYSLIWKHIAVIDLIVISSGFVLRAAVGSTAAQVPMSSWFVLVTTFGALFVVSGKRFAESRELGEGGATVRSTLAQYTPSYLRFVVGVSCSGAVVSYCVWAFERRELTGAELPWYELSIVPVIAAFLRYALVLDQGQGAAPEEVFIGDRILQLLGFSWITIFAFAAYA